MKKVILFIVFAFAFIVSVNAQRVYTPTADTLQGSETVNFAAIQSSSSDGSLAIQALCTQLGGTSDGSLVWQGSVDGTSYVNITTTTGLFNILPSDSLTITNGAVHTLLITNSPFNFYRSRGVGTASDTTLVTNKYTYKR